MRGIARQVVAAGDDAADVAARIVDELAGPGLALALVFADWRLAPSTIASIAPSDILPSGNRSSRSTASVRRPSMAMPG